MKLTQLMPKQVSEHFQKQADNKAIDQALKAFGEHVNFISKTSPATFLKNNGKTEHGLPANGEERLYFWDKTTAQPSAFNPDDILQRMHESKEFITLQQHIKEQVGDQIKLEPYCSSADTDVMIIGIRANAQSTELFDQALDKIKHNEDQNRTIDIRL